MVVHIHTTVIQYRNKNDFMFGSFRVRTGSAWMEITGRLKKTGTETIFTRLEYRSGNGKEYINREEDK